MDRVHSSAVDGASISTEQADRPVVADPVLQGLYSPKERKVGCVLLAAAHGIRDRRVNNIFDAADWFVAPLDDMMLMNAPMSQWRQVEAMPRDRRPGPEHFAAMRKARTATAASSVGTKGEARSAPSSPNPGASNEG